MLRRRIGDGLNGVVFLADDPHLGRSVAVKVLKDGERPGLDPMRFPREARAVGRLRHANVVSVHDAGHVGKVPYLVFEFVDGVTLWHTLSTEGALPLPRVAHLARQILDGLAHAHAHDVLHLDLSPRNIIVDRQGVAKIMDFGLARLADAPVEPRDEVNGTLLYMSPEHLGGEGLGPWSDVYSIGLILHELLTGRSAVPTGRVTDVLRRVASGQLDLGTLGEAGIDPAFVHLLLGALRADPGARYPDAGAMREALDDWLQARASESTPDVASHSTVAFLLRRMSRRKDFPGLSESLLEVNRLSAPDSGASSQQLASVILRDYALTNKLLKLANSAFYGANRGTVRNVSAAITLLGFEQVRTAANSLTFFGQLYEGQEDERLRDLLTVSFMAGLITRHLARVSHLPDPEGAFIAGLFQRLGKTLARYYFPEDDADVELAMSERGLSESVAARGVLGISYAELGAAVGDTWGFPPELVRCIRGIEADADGGARAEDDPLRDRAVYANALAALADEAGPGAGLAALDTLQRSFAERIPFATGDALTLLEHARVKLVEFAGALGIDLASNRLLERLDAFLARAREELEPEEASAASRRAG